jgi:hypothetical protein
LSGFKPQWIIGSRLGLVSEHASAKYALGAGWKDNLEGISKILKESNFTLLGRKVRGNGKWMANFTLDPPKPNPTRLRRKHDGKV